MKMKRNKITSSEFIDVIEFTSDLTKLPNEDQYLKHTAFNAITTLVLVGTGIKFAYNLYGCIENHFWLFKG